MIRRAATVVAAAFAVVVIGGACTRGVSAMSRVKVSLQNASPKSTAVVEAAARTAPGIASTHTIACGDTAIVVVDGPAVDAVTSAVSAVKPRLEPGVTAEVARVDDDVAVFAVRGKDAFAARAFVDTTLAPALLQVPGVTGVDVVGGARAQQVQIDLARLIENDLTVLEVVRAVGSAASLEQVIVKATGAPTTNAATEAPSMVKSATPPPAPGEVRLLLPQVAAIGALPIGEPLRRDGAVEVRVLGRLSGHAGDQPVVHLDAIANAAKKVAAPEGTEVVLLDDDSVEGLDVIVVAGRGEVDALQRELLAIPGVRIAPPERRLRIEVDPVRAALLGLAPKDVEIVKDVVQRGHTVMRNTSNVVVRLQGDASIDLLSQLVVGTTMSGGAKSPVRLSDVATLSDEIDRSDRLDGQAATRLHVVFDVGVRKKALQAVMGAVGFSRLPSTIERDDVAARLCR